ncbi:hypothetical protein F503_05488 [Ophiostoma piceae UAMH 11346]|uniref:Uncharacterized protein n=1 Tax=Ophiostoma piceae (strain UAMH 11346) TaxID=1262450 RepID=S3CUI8_OPHP1|nr:hypothetical protein F503_05488 [Ophiostoma piceae UAMH 11346]
MDDFRIPDTPIMAQSNPFDPYDGTSSVDITGLGVSVPVKSARLRGGELEIDTASTASAAQSRRCVPAHALQKASLYTEPNKCEKEPSRITYFSALTQRCDDHGRNVLICPTSNTTSKTTPRCSGDATKPVNYGAVFGRPHSQPWDNEAPARVAQNNGASQPGTVDAGYRGIQDAIATKFQDLEKQIEAQEHELTELRFSLNDANVATDALETDKRQLKQKNEDLERKLRKSGDKTTKLQQEVQRHQDSLKGAAKEQNRLQAEVANGEEKYKQEAKALTDARKTIKEITAQLEATQKEQQNFMQSTVGQNQRHMDASNKKISDLVSQLQLREAELQTQRDANIQLAQRIEDIPERNFQALSTCVKKVLEKLDNSKSEILTSEKSARLQSQEQVLGSISASDGHRKGMEESSQARLESIFSSLQDQLENQQVGILDAFSKKCRESDVLIDVCDKQETTSRNLATQLDEQLTMCREQSRHMQDTLCSLKKLEESPKEDPRMVAKIQVLQDQNGRLESEIKDKDTQITRLEEAYKERTSSILDATDGFVKEINQLNSSFREREVEYRRALDQASNLAGKEAKRSLDKARDEARNELQQERTKRQVLERDLRQAKEDCSVLEESNKRTQMSHEAAQKELNSAKLGNQAVTKHLEERAMALEAQIGRDTAIITKLKAALADKEMDYANLRSSMEAYNEKVHILIEHLRGWAQDYTHIGAIRSRLEMLGQMDQTCAATARIREAEQIDSVLALLRQYIARQNGREEKYDCGTGKGHTGPYVCSSDKDHEQRVADLSALLEAEVTSCNTVNYTSKDSLKTPANGTRTHQSSMKPPPVHNDRTFVVALEPDGSLVQSSPDIVSSPVPQRHRQIRRTTAANREEGHGLASPARTKASQRSGRKRSLNIAKQGETDTPCDLEPKTKRRHTETSAYFKNKGQGLGHEKMDNVVEEGDGPWDDISTSPPSFIKIEGM